MWFLSIFCRWNFNYKISWNMQNFNVKLDVLLNVRPVMLFVLLTPFYVGTKVFDQQYSGNEFAKLCALRALIFTRLNYAPCAPYLLFAPFNHSWYKISYYDVYIVYILYIHIHIKVNYIINRIYEKTFRSDLPTQKNLSFDELLATSYFLLVFVCTC